MKEIVFEISNQKFLMKEIIVRPDLAVLPMARETFVEKVAKLTGDSKQQIIAMANEFKNLDDGICNKVFLINKTALTLLIKETNPTFNPETDYIFVSSGGKNTIPRK